jgi:hypothetical protein
MICMLERTKAAAPLVYKSPSEKHNCKGQPPLLRTALPFVILGLNDTVYHYMQFASNVFNKEVAGCPPLSSGPIMLLQHTPGFSKMHKMRTCHQI